jgi:hypothetical protein
MSASGSEQVVVELISPELAWAFLHKFARTTPGAGSQLSALGVGTGASFASHDKACTVAQHLAYCPTVARVLWLETAADCVRNVIRPQQARGNTVEVIGERPEVWDVLFEYGVGLIGRRQPDVAMRNEVERLERTQVYHEQMALMVVELSACCAADPAFRAWVDGKT